MSIDEKAVVCLGIEYCFCDIYKCGCVAGEFRTCETFYYIYCLLKGVRELFRVFVPSVFVVKVKSTYF